MKEKATSKKDCSTQTTEEYFPPVNVMCIKSDHLLGAIRHIVNVFQSGLQRNLTGATININDPKYSELFLNLKKTCNIPDEMGLHLTAEPDKNSNSLFQYYHSAVLYIPAAKNGEVVQAYIKIKYHPLIALPFNIYKIKAFFCGDQHSDAKLQYPEDIVHDTNIVKFHIDDTQTPKALKIDFISSGVETKELLSVPYLGDSHEILT